MKDETYPHEISLGFAEDINTKMGKLAEVTERFTRAAGEIFRLLEEQKKNPSPERQRRIDYIKALSNIAQLYGGRLLEEIEALEEAERLTTQVALDNSVQKPKA